MASQDLQTATLGRHHNSIAESEIFQTLFTDVFHPAIEEGYVGLNLGYITTC